MKKLLEYIKELLFKQNNNVEINGDYLTFKDTGQIYINSDVLSMYSYSNKDLELGSGNDVIINAGNKKIELRVGNENVITITKDRIDINSKDIYINNNKINK